MGVLASGKTDVGKSPLGIHPFGFSGWRLVTLKTIEGSSGLGNRMLDVGGADAEDTDEMSSDGSVEPLRVVRVSCVRS